MISRRCEDVKGYVQTRAHARFVARARHDARIERYRAQLRVARGLHFSGMFAVCVRTVLAARVSRGRVHYMLRPRAEITACSAAHTPI
jgi:hypothetical protein